MMTNIITICEILGSRGSECDVPTSRDSVDS
jgi:hypothetical protein